MRKNLSKMFFGIAVVAAGIIFLGSAFGFWEIGELSGLVDCVHYCPRYRQHDSLGS